MTELVSFTVTGDGIADIRLNRPDKMNALSMPLFEAINAAAGRVIEDRGIRAVVLSGEGRAFCAGIDTSLFTDPAMAGANFFGEGRGGYWPNFYQKPGWLWREVPVPVIAALHGVVFGGGFQIAMGADIRIAHPETRLSLMEIKWGLVPDMSGSQTLRGLVRQDIAKELAFTGRIVEAPEAERIGLVTRLDAEPRAAAMALAQSMVRRNPDALALAKQLFQQGWEGSCLEGLELEERLQKQLLPSDNQAEAVKAEITRQPPQYRPRAIGRLPT